MKLLVIFHESVFRSLNVLTIFIVRSLWERDSNKKKHESGPSLLLII